MSKSPYQEALMDLKDFQLKTVNYVFDRFYGDLPTRRYLVADEVGLGKTMVARGIIAKTIEHLLYERSVKRIDVVYICSNISIASQNIDKLKIEQPSDAKQNEKSNFAATRLTYLPIQVKQLQANPINFISLTAGTTFDNSSRRSGTAAERAIIYHMLYDLPWAHGKLRQTYRRGLVNLLQGHVLKPNWDGECNYYHLADNHYKRFPKDTRRDKKSCNRCIDSDIARDFRKQVLSDTELYYKLKDCAYRFKRRRKYVPSEDNELRWDVVGKLRRVLAHACVSALEPDLVIMDEFQRFQDLMDGKSESARLAEAVFDYGNTRVLLLSATPYKMLTLPSEVGNQNHYQEFLATLSFLFSRDDQEIGRVEHLIADWRQAILRNSFGDGETNKVKVSLEKQLLKVMCRTERVRFTKEFNAMVSEDRLDDDISLTPEDLHHARFMDKLTRDLDAGDIREYWKSAPYLLNYLKGYVLRRKFDKVIADSSDTNRDAYALLLSQLKQSSSQMLAGEDIDNYRQVEIANARLRSLFKETLDRGMWKYLWIPASLPYSKPSGVYSESQGITKSVIFSSWNAVPDAISTLCSYEAERRMVEGTTREEGYHRDVTQPLSIDRKANKRQILTWILPFPTLAKLIDPLRISLERGDGSPITVRTLLAAVKALISEQLDELQKFVSSPKRDSHWYWLAPLLIEQNHHDYLSWVRENFELDKQQTADSALYMHLLEAVRVATSPEGLGSFPKDLVEYLAQIALGAPSTCIYRALARNFDPEDDQQQATLYEAAYQIAYSFRTIFNAPEVVSLISKEVSGRTFLRKSLKYNIDGNLQAVLDEYIHHLTETPNSRLKSFGKRTHDLVDHICAVLSLRTAQLSVDEIKLRDNTILKDEIKIRTRFALRYSDFREDQEGSVIRANTVRDAFNSPFRPFVLTSTSVGQEGLDFHLWCHSIIHWNLPSNPVDLEQREGRIHRYKSLAIRRNIAEIFGLRSLEGWDGTGDPWEVIFSAARKDNEDKPELIPFWIFDQGSTKIQRRLPLLPFSREESKIDQLKRGLSLYRLVFGQPRQGDLLDRIDFSDPESLDYRTHLISLEPPDMFDGK